MHYQPQRDLLRNHIILVTGASDGIGKEAALTYASHGARLILLGRNEQKLRQVADQIAQEGGQAASQQLLGLAACTPQDCHALAGQLASQ